MRTIFLSISLFVSVYSFAQIHNPVKWDASVTEMTEDTAVVTFTANIEKGWHIYSQHLNIENGPIATSFAFSPNQAYKLVGNTIEGNPVRKSEPAFDNMLLSYFEGSASFSQKIAVHGNDSFKLVAAITYMACSENMCLPPGMQDVMVDIYQPSNDQQPGKINHQEYSKGAGLAGWAIFFGGFIGGLLALLTPCVFPMLPLTVGFFTKQSKTRVKGLRNAFIYAISIILIYVTLGLTTTLALGPDALNALASNGLVNLAFFVIFVVFAISFFGAFEILLPNKWLNAADRVSDKGGLIGIFFMAFTLSLVSFSCTGPIIGSLLVQAAVYGNVTGPAIGMFGFALALALPFALFAAFPGWLNSLPKSGSWLNSIKVILGFVELALALKFLSSVDLAYHWGILTREIFIALWIVIFSLLGFYLLGKLRLPHDSEQKSTSVGGLMISVLIFGFVVYLIPGMWGAPLKLISGFPPPSFYTEGWNLQNIQARENNPENIAFSDNEFRCPLNLNCFHDYEEGLAYATKVNKPVILDFTGWSCVNCRKMEDKVWSDKTVFDLLNNKYVLISLYVDDKTVLPEDKQYISQTTGKKVKTIGNKWSDFQTKHFNTNSQPYYVVIDHQGNTLASPVAYDPNIVRYIDFLHMGLESFNRKIAYKSNHIQSNSKI